MGDVGGKVLVVLLNVWLAGMVRKNLSFGILCDGICGVVSVDNVNSGLLWIFSCPPPPLLPPSPPPPP